MILRMFSFEKENETLISFWKENGMMIFSLMEKEIYQEHQLKMV